jgi:uncharacterized membrane protein
MIYAMPWKTLSAILRALPALSKQKRNLPSHQGQQPGGVHQRQFIHQVQEVRVGPLPPAEDLAKFDQVLPGLAERIVKMAENNAVDRQRTNRTNRWATIVGLIFAFVFLMSALATGVWLTLEGRDTAGVSTILGTVAAPAIALIVRKRQKPSGD